MVEKSVKTARNGLKISQLARHEGTTAGEVRGFWMSISGAKGYEVFVKSTAAFMHPPAAKWRMQPFNGIGIFPAEFGEWAAIFDSAFFHQSNFKFMQKFQTILFGSFLLAAMSFTGVPFSNQMLLETTTYGVCGCEKEAAASPKVELTLRPDYTFQYQNGSNPSKKINVTGTWEMNGQKVVLQADASENGFHKTWKFDKNQPCVVSRKGLNFIRLCDVESCK